MKSSTGNNRFKPLFDRYFQIVQHLWVVKMNTLTQGLSRKKLICGLMVFTVFSGSFFINKIVQVFSNTATVSLKIPAESKPLAVGEKNRELITIESSLSKAELERLNNFRHYLDSLSSDKQGRKIYDSIKRSRPGLIDSLAFIEEYYNINFKK